MPITLTQIIFTDNIKNLDVNMLSEYPRQISKEFAKALGDKKNQRTQIRKFYDEVVMWDERISLAQNKIQEFKENEVVFKMLRAKIAYSLGRSHIDKYCADMLDHCIKSVDSAEKLMQFRLFFEALMGYYRAEKDPK